MNRRVSLSLLLSAALACSGPGTDSAPNRATDEAAIQAVLQGWVDASVEGDAEAYASFITEDFVYLGPGAPARDGRAEVTDWVSGFFDAVSFDFEWETDEIIISGDLAVHRYSGVATLRSTDGGAPSYADRKYIDILRRENGRWLTSRHMFNLND